MTVKKVTGIFWHITVGIFENICVAFFRQAYRLFIQLLLLHVIEFKIQRVAK